MNLALSALPWRQDAAGRPLRFPLGEPGDPVLIMLPPRLETIPVSSVVGSVGRHAYLDRRFRPRSGNGQRLRAIRAIMEAGVSLPPIDIYRLHGGCYVIDGHHRVAAAREIGQLYIEALVTECRERTVGAENPLEGARIRFTLLTSLSTISFSTAAGYEQALDQIYEHRWYMSEQGAAASLRDAAQSWFRTVFGPVIGQIAREQPGLTTESTEAGDLYLGLSDLKWVISRQRGHDIGFAATVREWASQQQRDRGAWLSRIMRFIAATPFTGRRQRA